MFYSHEILTSRKYGVATVWLVATLGAKSNTKKVSKKAILDVNLSKACETIMQPEAPMALRLQSNLLYGVSRVYDQQCGYVLSDAQAAQLKMRDLMKIARNNDLDPSAMEARLDQLVLTDDPAFLPDMALPALDFDFSNLELERSANSQHSSQSMMSIRHRSGSLSSHGGSGIGINLLSSSSQGGGAYQLPNNDPFVESSANKAFGAGRTLFNDEEGILYQDDMLFEFDADGRIIDIDVNEREANRGAVLPSGQGRLESDSAASGRVRKEHADAATGRVLPILDGEGDFDMMNFGDDDAHILPDADPFPVMAGGLGSSGRTNPLLVEEEDTISSHQPSSDTAEAPAKRRKPKQKKTLTADHVLELRNSDLAVWQTDYLTNMATASVPHVQKNEAAQAKKNADAWVIGNGLNDVGQGVGSSKLPSPLALFSGPSLMAKITGKPAPGAEVKGKKGTKRSLSNDIEDVHSSPSKRARQDDGYGGFEDEIGRNFDDDIILNDSSPGVEIGREAPSALADYPSSALMPWNVSASLNSRHRGASSSIQGGRAGSILAGSVNNKRLRSTSPLVGRGSNIPGELEQFSSQLNDMVMYGRSDNDNGIESEAARSKRGESLLAARGVNISSSQAEFEIFGPAAQVDTQTAGNSQWVKDALDRESGNFFQYVCNTISEKTAGDELDDLGGGDGDGGAGAAAGEKFVTFEELFNPAQNSAMVAAQAFYHVLSLATKARVWAEQDLDEEEMEPFREIRIGVLA